MIAMFVAAAMGTVLWAGAAKEQPSGVAMGEAAANFQRSLTPAQRDQATFDFGDAERLNWHFISRERKELPLKDLEGAPLRAAHALIRSGLSDAGYTQALDVMSLEEVLYLLEDGDRDQVSRGRHCDRAPPGGIPVATCAGAGVAQGGSRMAELSPERTGRACS